MRICSTVLAAVAALAVAAGPARAQAIEVGPVVECLEAVPAAVASPLPGENIDVRVHVVLDQGVTLEEGERTMQWAQDAYSLLGMTLIPSYTTAVTSADDTDTIFKELKALFGGQRPAYAHLVYLLTKRDIAAGAGGTAVAGQADCIGGVMYPETAFAVGEYSDEPGDGEGGLFGFGVRQSARIAGHEIGHLFGAHHHYANCVEAAGNETDAHQCTLMFNDVGLTGLKFSSLNASVVRGHALAYLQPVTASPPPTMSPTVPPAKEEIPACDLTAYRDIAGDHAHFVVNNPDDIDLLTGSFHTATDGVTRFRWKLSSLDGDFGPVATKTIYMVHITSPENYVIEAEWDGEHAPTARILDGPQLRATIVPGPGGVIEVELPLAELGLSGKPMTLGYMSARTDVDDVIDYDNAEPIVPSVTPAACLPKPAIVKVPSVEGPGHAPAAAKPAAPPRISILGSLRRGLKAKVAGKGRDVRIRLTDARGRTIATGRIARLDGTRTVKLRVVRRRARGTANLVVTLGGQTVVTRGVRLR